MSVTEFFPFWLVSLYWRLMIQWRLRHVIAHLPAHVILWIMSQRMATNTTCPRQLTRSAWWAYAKWLESIW